MSTFTNRALSAALLTLVAVNCHAQFGGGMGSMRRGNGAMAPGASSWQPSAPQPSRVEQITSRLYDLRIRLLISPAQTPAWDVFHDHFFEYASSGNRSVSALAEQSALQSMQLLLSQAQNRYAMAEALNEATKVLYVALTPEQQRTADQMIPALFAEPAADRERRSPSR